MNKYVWLVISIFVTIGALFFRLTSSPDIMDNRIVYQHDDPKWVKMSAACHTLNGRTVYIYDDGKIIDVRCQFGSSNW